MATTRLSETDFHEIFARVPRLTVELVLATSDGVVLTRRVTGPCAGLWHLPGGTVRYGEPLVDAVRRVGREELGCEVNPGRLLGYIEYPSHLAAGIDWPVGIAFRCDVEDQARLPASTHLIYSSDLGVELHDEQRTFLSSLGFGATSPR